jgi:hypothetical protein
MIHNRPRGWKQKKNSVRIQCHAHPDIVEWVDRYCDSRERARSHIGTQALLFYFFSYSWGPSWLSTPEFLVSPDDGDRNDYIISGYATPSYATWLDGLPKTVRKLDHESSPEYWAEIKNNFSTRIYSVRSRSMHLRRALILYWKACLVMPELIEIDFDGMRPEGFEFVRHDFDNLNYTFAYTAKIKRLVPIDLSKPPAITLFTKD